MALMISDQAKRSRTIALLILVLSVVLPIGIVRGSIALAFSGKPFGKISSDSVSYQGFSIRNGELSFARVTNSADLLQPIRDCRIKRVNLTTGIESEIGHIAARPPLQTIWIKNDFYVVTGMFVYKLVNNSLEKIALTPPGSHVLGFHFNDRLTTVLRTPESGEFRLMHLVGDEWTEGRLIRMPTLGSIWDEERDRLSLPLPMPTFNVAQVSPFPLTDRNVSNANYRSLDVVAFEQQAYLFAEFSGPSANGRFMAYRLGFEYADEFRENASASTPENADASVSEWKRIPLMPGGSFIGTAFGVDHQGGLIVVQPLSGRFIRLLPNGKWKTMNEVDALRSNGILSVLIDSGEQTTYVIEMNHQWNSLKVSRLDGMTVHPPCLVVPGLYAEYLARWRHLVIGLSIAWLLHVVFLAVGAALPTSGKINSEYRFGNQRATLAPIFRRSLALLIDQLTFVVAVLGFPIILQLCNNGGRVNWLTGNQISGHLYHLESALKYVFDCWVTLSPTIDLRLTIQILKQYGFDQKSIRNLIGVVLALWCLKTSLECYCGTTLGQQTFGIRVVKSTLGPTGLCQRIVRTVLYFVDIPLLITPFPAAVSMMFSEHGQRIGDRVADTIVVKSGSIREADEHDRR